MSKLANSTPDQNSPKIQITPKPIYKNKAGQTPQLNQTKQNGKAIKNIIKPNLSQLQQTADRMNTKIPQNIKQQTEASLYQQTSINQTIQKPQQQNYQNFVIRAIDKKTDLSLSPKLFLFLGGFTLMIIVSYFVMANLISTAIISVASIIIFIQLSRPPEVISVIFSIDGIIIEGILTPWQHIVSWAQLDYKNNIAEITMKTDLIQNPYISFFIDKSKVNSKKIRDQLNLFCNNNQKIASDSQFQSLIRGFGLK